MAKTVLITGTSSGIGKAAVLEFAKHGWNVAATMRHPEKETAFKRLSNVRLYALDVTDNGSIQKAFDAAKSDFGQLDVVVNNAGYGLDGVFEAMTDDDIKKQFDTNVFGLMRVTRQAIKLMRVQGGGKIIQISSMGGRLAFPFYSIYHASKWAVEGFTESLHYELRPFNIQLKMIEPGLIQSEFYGTSRHFVKPDNDTAYEAYMAKFEKAVNDAMKDAEIPATVAKTIVKAADDKSSKMRYPVGKPAPMLLLLKRLVPDTWFFNMVRMNYKI